MNENINNKVIRCECGTPIIKRLNSRELEFLKYSKGEPVKSTLKYSGDHAEIKCEKCGKIVNFDTNKKSLPLTYVVAPLKIKSRKR